MAAAALVPAPEAALQQQQRDDYEEIAVDAAARARDRFVLVPSWVPMELSAVDFQGLPECMVVTGVRMTGQLGLQIARTLAGKAALSFAAGSASTVARQLAADAAKVAKVQQAAARQILLRVPVLGSDVIDRICGRIGLDELDKAGAGELLKNVRSFGFNGHVLVMTAGLLVHETRDVLRLAGGGGVQPFLRQTIANVAIACGGIAGAAAGTCLGTLALPGIGTGVGSFAGSLLGAVAAEAAATELLDRCAPTLEMREDGYMMVSQGSAAAGAGCVELMLEAKGGDEGRDLIIECDCGGEAGDIAGVISDPSGSGSAAQVQSSECDDDFHVVPAEPEGAEDDAAVGADFCHVPPAVPRGRV